MFGSAGLIWTVIGGIGGAVVKLVKNAKQGTQAAAQAAESAGDALNWRWLETTGEKIQGQHDSAEEAFNAAVGHTTGPTSVNWAGAKAVLALDALPITSKWSGAMPELKSLGKNTLFNDQWRRQEDLAQEGVSYDMAHGLGAWESGTIGGPLLLGGLGILAYTLYKKG